MSISTRQQLHFSLSFVKNNLKYLKLFSFDTVITTTRPNNGCEVDFFKVL